MKFAYSRLFDQASCELVCAFRFGEYRSDLSCHRFRLPTQPLDKRAWKNAVLSTGSQLGGFRADVPLLIRAAMAEDCPDYSSDLVCYRDDDYIRRSALFDLIKPRGRLL